MPNLTDEEMAKFDKWLDTKDLKRYTGAIGGRFTYCYTPTSIGTIVKIKDNLDGDELDVSDYDSW